MYQTKTAGILELLMNALYVPASRRAHVARRTAYVPVRRERAVEPSMRGAVTRKETYFEAARLSRWNR